MYTNIFEETVQRFPLSIEKNQCKIELDLKYYIASLEKSKETHDEIKLGCFSIFQRQKRKENRKIFRKNYFCHILNIESFY